jgi:integrase
MADGRRLAASSTRLSSCELHCSGVPAAAIPAPRIYDLRHSFICHRLEDWYAQGLDIDRSILALSTYVGHVKVTDTYWYVTATPELMASAAQRFTRGAGGVS